MNDFQKTLNKIFKSPGYIIGLVFLSLIVLLAISFLQNSGQALAVFSYKLELFQKILLIQKILIYFYTGNLTWFAVTLYLTLAILFAYNLILIFYYFKKRNQFASLGKVSLSGLLASLGVGCATCGGVLLTSVVGGVGATSLLTILPYSGSEFLVISILVLIYSIFSISKKINAPLVC